MSLQYFRNVNNFSLSGYHRSSDTCDQCSNWISFIPLLRINFCHSVYASVSTHTYILVSNYSIGSRMFNLNMHIYIVCMLNIPTRTYPEEIVYCVKYSSFIKA